MKYNHRISSEYNNSSNNLPVANSGSNSIACFCTAMSTPYQPLDLSSRPLQIVYHLDILRFCKCCTAIYHNNIMNAVSKTSQGGGSSYKTIANDGPHPYIKHGGVDEEDPLLAQPAHTKQSVQLLTSVSTVVAVLLLGRICALEMLGIISYQAILNTDASRRVHLQC